MAISSMRNKGSAGFPFAFFFSNSGYCFGLWQSNRKRKTLVCELTLFLFSWEGKSEDVGLWGLILQVSFRLKYLVLASFFRTRVTCLSCLAKTESGFWEIPVVIVLLISFLGFFCLSFLKEKKTEVGFWLEGLGVWWTCEVCNGREGKLHNMNLD